MEARMQSFRMFRFIMIFYLIVHVRAMKADEKGRRQLCRYWCRTIDHRYYCCPSGEAGNWLKYVWHSFLNPLWMVAVESPPLELLLPEIFVHEKETKKYCPPLRIHCPRTYDWYSPSPTSCDDDEDCDKKEKCCYDVCLEHKTCKHIE
ncbi:PREDICTED: uncharacterized protein LOC108552872 [Eufriesea mexicana]|uniref:uncharacterized protein LOC108552872 n=1 Tax=Eufriesea mexicana TaxID=516756 RepID=UPI00083C701F|nr:PREDICTED: uncharacterized protein LOC108552872 [Eufriesea mexicana]